MLYITKCWAVKNQHIYKISVAEMRMLRWISENCEYTKRGDLK